MNTIFSNVYSICKWRFKKRHDKNRNEIDPKCVCWNWPEMCVLKSHLKCVCVETVPKMHVPTNWTWNMCSCHLPQTFNPINYTKLILNKQLNNIKIKKFKIQIHKKLRFHESYDIHLVWQSRRVVSFWRIQKVLQTTPNQQEILLSRGGNVVRIVFMLMFFPV